MTQEIKPEYYIQLDYELKQKYSEYMGIEQEDRYYKSFNKQEQIERYAKNVAFWMLEKCSECNSSMTGRALAKEFMVSKKLADLHSNIHNKFNDVKQQIYDRVNELTCPKGKRIQQIKEQMEKWGLHADQLHRQCIQDKCDDILEPHIWIYKQDSMRKSWESWRENMENKSPVVRQLLDNNSFTKYMDFMYDTYPAGFGNSLTESRENDDYCDGAEIFYNMTNNDNTYEPEPAEPEPERPLKEKKSFKKKQRKKNRRRR